MKRFFICNLLIAVLFCCGFIANAQSLQDEGVSAKLAPWKTQFKAASVGYVYGDVNGDEKTDISDVVSIINAIAQNDKSNPRADVNEDGAIDISDVVKVINIMAGLDTPPITVDKSSLEMTTGESEDVRIVRVSGSGDYEVTNENPDIVTVEWLSNSSTASERRKVKAAGETEIGEGDSFSADGFLKVYALQPGQAKITVVDKNTSKKLIVSITVTADYNTEIFTDFCPNNATYVAGSTVACTFAVMPPSTGELKCRIILSEEPDMSGTTQTADITINGTEGEKKVYNEKGETTTFSNLKSDTKYYWRITYYDTRSGSYVNGSPINWFKTITTEDPAVAAGLCPDGNHPHIIDMGEAGKWSCCNVGASAPWEYGGYYAWGETEEKESYSWKNYIHCDGSYDTCHDLGEDIAGTEYDVAHVKWGGNWCMPSRIQQDNLIQNCSSEWTSLNGVFGRKYISPDGGAIFLPAAGYTRYEESMSINEDGNYWSSTPYGYVTDKNSQAAFYLNFNNNKNEWYFTSRVWGRTVRPVIYESEPDFEPEPEDPANLCPDESHPHIIDMGDAGKWACCNVGASAPWEYGGYYAWGETEEKDNYSVETYIHCDGSYENFHNLGSDIAGTQYDVAYVKWGNMWCLPSVEQIKILLNHCNNEWRTVNGIKGIKFTAPNGRTIFLPAAASYNSDDVGFWGYYWSSTQIPNELYYAYSLNFNPTDSYWSSTNTRNYGFSVRPVISEDPAVTAGLCPDSNHPHIIDMGPAGKWSCCNVGANAPWEYGGYYAWGETEEKENYSWETYVHCDGSYDTCHDLGEDIAGTEYDVAHVKWGGSWCMPSAEQLELLCINCYSERTSINEINGRKFTAPNGGTIFLPATGCRWHDEMGDVDKYGEYWSSTQTPFFSNCAYYYLNDEKQHTDRFSGCSVRPIISEPESEVSAVAAGLCPDENHPHIIDMGPAGKWSCCNVGANAPWEYGDYYAWGETEEKDNYSWETYIHCDGSYDTCHELGEDISGTEYDVAHVKWGENWCMPSHDQQLLLLDNCTSKWMSVNKIIGRKFTAPNGGTIFLPAAGYRQDGNTYFVGSYGYYWSSIQSPDCSYYAYYPYFNKGDWYSSYGNRCYGQPVRPVMSGFEPEPRDPAVAAGLCPDSNHPHIIDMGEAGKWSCCNVGALTPWEYGGYYAWGETEEKERYSWENYIHCDGSNQTCHDLGEDISGTQYDVAHVKWGGKWRMPSFEQIKLLLNCSSEWTEVNGIYGRKFIAPNGGTIFLPAAGFRFYDDHTSYVGDNGYYWSSTQDPDFSYNAYFITFYSSGEYWSSMDYGRYCGRGVRPVTE